MTSDPFLVVGVHHCLGGGTNGDGLLEIRVACLGDPGDFGGKPLDVIFFLFEDAFGDEHGEVGIFNAHFLDLSIKPVYRVRWQRRIGFWQGFTLDDFPDGIGPGLHDVAARDIVVVKLL